MVFPEASLQDHLLKHIKNLNVRSKSHISGRFQYILNLGRPPYLMNGQYDLSGPVLDPFMFVFIFSFFFF